jgi:hypothetical protein
MQNKRVQCTVHGNAVKKSFLPRAKYNFTSARSIKFAKKSIETQIALSEFPFS